MIDGVAGGLKNEEYDGGKNRFFAFTPLPDTLGVTTYDFVTFGALPLLHEIQKGWFV